MNVLESLDVCHWHSKSAHPDDAMDRGACRAFDFFKILYVFCLETKCNHNQKLSNRGWMKLPFAIGIGQWWHERFTGALENGDRPRWCHRKWNQVLVHSDVEKTSNLGGCRLATIPSKCIWGGGFTCFFPTWRLGWQGSGSSHEILRWKGLKVFPSSYKKTNWIAFKVLKLQNV